MKPGARRPVGVRGASSRPGGRQEGAGGDAAGGAGSGQCSGQCAQEAVTGWEITYHLMEI